MTKITFCPGLKNLTYEEFVLDYVAYCIKKEGRFVSPNKFSEDIVKEIKQYQRDGEMLEETIVRVLRKHKREVRIKFMQEKIFTSSV